MAANTAKRLAGAGVLTSTIALGAFALPQGAGAQLPSNACPDHVTAGAGLGITALAPELEDTYGRLFCKYTDVVAPNGKPIRMFAQREISNDQLIHARSVLEFFLEPVPGSRYGADKSAIANSMADNRATLLMLKGHDGEFEFERVRGVRGQPLYEDETVPTGHPWYMDNVYEGHRDASFEEILHLVHDTGIGIDVARAPLGAAPDYQQEIRTAQINALDTNALWAQGGRTADWIAELRDEGSLTQEYLASVVDSYYGLWGAYTEREGGMWGIYVAKTREEIAAKDPRGYALHRASGSLTLTDSASARDGADTLRNIEFVQFTDGVVAVTELR